MVRFVSKCFIFIAALIFLVSATFAADFPGQGEKASPQVGVSQPNAQQQLFSGYVPPPPIRHTWPGGYKVIFHEMMNTLMDHIVGQY